MIKIENNSILKDNLKYEFDYQIRQVVNGNDCYVVLVSVPAREPVFDNIFCLDQQLNLLWKVNDPDDDYKAMRTSSYELMFLDMNGVKAIDSSGKCFDISLTDGRIRGLAGI